MAGLDKRLYDIEKNPCSTTGYTNVIQIKGKHQARLQVPGDGRGGKRKRRQCSLPTTFEKAEDAALYLAWVKTLPLTDWVDGMPPKLTDRKPRTKKPAKPVEPAQAAEPRAEPSMPSAMTMPYGCANQFSNATCAVPGRIAASDAAAWLCAAVQLCYVSGSADNCYIYSLIYYVSYVSRYVQCCVPEPKTYA